MKTRRWWGYGLAISGFFVIVAAIWLRSLPQARLSEAVYNKMNVGMTLADIEQLVGVPPQRCVSAGPDDVSDAFGDFNSFQAKTALTGSRIEYRDTTRPLSMPLSLTEYADGQNQETRFMWRGPNRALLVVVDNQGKVTQFAYGRLTIAPKSWQARFKFWFDSLLEDKE